MKTANPIKMSAAAQGKLVADPNLSKSAKIKQLFDAGNDVKTIASIMDIRYNFAYNVVSNYINMNDIQVNKDTKVNKKDLIIEQHIAGKSNKEISIELKTNYNYVFNTIKNYKMNQADQTEQQG